YCDGAQEARELHGVEVRLTPDIPRGYTDEEAETTARYSVAYRDRGVVGLGLGGLEADYPPELYERSFAIAREGGLASVPHAGEAAGADSVRGALEALGADRIRHGIRAEEDPGLVRELAGRGTVLDVCPLSNLRTGAVARLADHPLPRLVAAGLRCSISTDDPAMFDTHLSRDYDAPESCALSPRSLYRQGKIPGSFYTGRGNEAAAVGVATAMKQEDVGTPLHRDMGVHITRGVEPWRIFAQYMGRADGPTKGRDGNVHMADAQLGL